MAGLNDFAGVPPYDSELLGIFQPLLGWRGRNGLRLQRRALIEGMASVALQNGATAAAGSPVVPSPDVTGNPVLDNLVAQVAAANPGRTELSDGEWRAALTGDVVQSAV